MTVNGLECASLSFRVAFMAVALGLLPGLVTAWTLAFRRFPLKPFAEVAVLLPAALPPTVVGLLLLMLASADGPLGRAAMYLGLGPLLLTPKAAVLAGLVVGWPFMVQGTRGALAAVPGEVLEAAAMDGANGWRTALHVVLPLAWPGIWSGILMAFARALGEFGATAMVAGNIPGRTQTLPMAIYSAVQSGRSQDAMALALLLGGGAFASLMIARLLGGRLAVS